MRLTDSHSHIFLEEFDGDREEAVARAREAGVHRFLLPNVDASTVGRMTECCEANSDCMFPMMGIHPTSIDEGAGEQLKLFDDMISSGRKYVAIGEIGLDRHWGDEHFEAQKRAFEYQVAAAVELGLPVSIHSRDAFGDVLACLRKFDHNKLRGVFHCFTLSPEAALQAFAAGDFYLGIGGPATYKNAKFQLRLPELPLDRMLLETDCPYLPPVPHRGERNEPAYVVHVAERLAALYGIEIGELCAATEANCERLFFNAPS